MVRHNSTIVTPHGESPQAVLAPHHYAMLVEESGIAPELITARGYRTVTTKADLVTLGFARGQCRVPALLLPVYNPYGELVLYQARPDTPRIKDGHLLKYETPHGALMALDVPPTEVNRLALRDPQIPLWITEGIKKGDALVTVEACTIALLGVWNWRGTNEEGGKTVLAAFEAIALNARQIFIAYDSDVMLKPAVALALTRLSTWLVSRGATLAYVYLPSGNGGSKQGVDDFLAQGHTLADLVALATATQRPLPFDRSPRPCPYAATPRGLVMRRETREGEATIPLANFTATICTDLVTDDGAERRRLVELEACLGARSTRFTIPAAAFAGMTWVVDHLGPEAIVMPGVMLKEHCRTAIQMLSTHIMRHTVYTHSGWRQLGDAWCYLHGAGAIGPRGVVPDVDVVLGDGLQRYLLPSPPTTEAARDAIHASLGLLDVAPDTVIFPLYMAIWRAVLGEAAFSVYLVGPTGVGKSALAALAQQHFGAGMDAQHLPGSWTSTTNALGELQFLAKDALLTIDDFCPTGPQADQQRLHRDADRILRSQGNSASRRRMRPDRSLQEPKPPRGLIVATGEDLPRGQSLQARLLVLELDATAVDWTALSQCQQQAADGTYTTALAGFVHWVAPQYDTMQAAMRSEIARLQQQIQQPGHKRTADIAAHLGFGWQMFLDYAYSTGALTDEEKDVYWRRGQQVLTTVATAQADFQRSEDPVERFFAVLHAVLSSGQGHLAEKDTNHIPTTDADHYGWRNASVHPSSPTPSASMPAEHHPADTWRPQGPRMGWLDADYLYLTPDATYTAIAQMTREQGDAFHMTQRTLWKRLGERGVFIREPDQSHYTARVRVHGKRERVLKISRSLYSEKSGPSGPSGPNDDNLHKDNGLGTGSLGPLAHTAPLEWSQWSHPAHQDQSVGPLGPLPKDPNQEWSQDSRQEDTENQADRSSGTTGTTGTTFVDILSRTGDKHVHSSGISRACPHCRAQRSQVTGASRMCLACGHTWQAELP